MNTQTPYDVLGLSRGASPEEVRRAYRDKARVLHPDVNASSDADEAFSEIQGAYELLSDPGKRAKLDERLARAEGAGTVGGLHMDWTNIATRRSRGAARDGAGPGRRADPGDPTGFEEMYEALFQTRVDQLRRAK